MYLGMILTAPFYKQSAKSSVCLSDLEKSFAS
jgi:hypothetical protein